MENNTMLAVDACLDQLLRQTITEQAAKKVLMANQVTNADTSIVLHKQAVAMLQRYQAIKQVQDVRLAYLQQRNAQETIQLRSTAKIVKLRPVKWMLRIASVLLLSFSLVLSYQFTNNSGDKLYSELYHQYNITVQRDVVLPLDGINKIVVLYEEKDYSGVVSSYGQRPDATGRETFLTALAHSELKQYDKAVVLFESLLAANKASGTRLYKDDAEYYLGLASLQQKDYTKSYTVFKAISQDPSHTYYQEVSKWLLMRLKWLK